MYQLASEAKVVATRILYDADASVYHVSCADLEVLPIFQQLARTMKIKTNPDGSWTFPKNAPLGMDEWSPAARGRIEFGLAHNPHIDASAPGIQTPGGQVVQHATIKSGEKQRRLHGESVGPVQAVRLPNAGDAPDPRDVVQPVNSGNLKRLFGGDGQ
jgi:hypothetical protein